MTSSPWDSLTKRRPSAAEVQDARERMNLVSQVSDLQDRMGEVEQASQDVADHLGYAGDNYLVPVNDNIPPAAPTGLVEIRANRTAKGAPINAPVTLDEIEAAERTINGS